MEKLQLGKKYLCQSCGARFYDLNKDPAICPKCGVEYSAPVKKGPGANKKIKTNEEKIVAESTGDGNEILDVEELDDLDADVDQDEDLMEDTSDLGESEDEMQEVKDRASIDDMEK